MYIRQLAFVDDVRAVDRAIEGIGLASAARATLKSYPGCVHWHLKSPGSGGTLELTWWPQEGRLWFKIAANRSAPWMKEAMDAISENLKV